MKFDIIGGGSLGLLFGGRLAGAGAGVTVWTRSERQAYLLGSGGIRLRSPDAEERIVRVDGKWIETAHMEPEAGASPGQAPVRFIILAVKQTDLNDGLLRQIGRLAARGDGMASAVVCLQNGIGHMERIQTVLPEAPLVAAVTTEGAKRLDARTVVHTGSGRTWLGEWGTVASRHGDTRESSQKMLVSMLESAGFAAFLSNDMKDRMYNKLLINAVINPLTALFDVTNGELPAHPARRRLMRALYDESECLLRQAGIATDPDGWQAVLDVCDRTSGNISSMLGDVRSGRRTEIDAINGGIIRLARQWKLKSPLNEAVTELIHALHKEPLTKGAKDHGDDLGEH
ncbi:ketopantoate reductase family protein [Paenibacillus arenilitoris]|uniref:2-dehydropantoate 2-reductase n=1 Tax=Paenibacillus arenilitoris TaxID=2772299 RepID=A0A927H6M4_9BACL|nr:2-dehydropantoate 2-reductase [Paenibacillus arenilitoris]MBD2870140.1 2-dehydropantoate 2-reductase [Paenibacillus arenilitoris]